MKDHVSQERPGLHVEHLRQLVRLRRSSGWLGLLAIIAALAIYQLHRSEPALFEAADTHASCRPASTHLHGTVLCHSATR